MNPVPQRILVTYASRHGATKGIAQAMADSLSAVGAQVDTLWINDISSLARYDLIIIGSPIRYDKWLPEAVDFVKAHQTTLTALPVALFFSCLTLASTSDKATRQATKYAETVSALLPQVTAANVGQFAGVLDYSKMPAPVRLIARTLFAILRVKQGDYRNWSAIRDWAIGSRVTNPPETKEY